MGVVFLLGSGISIDAGMPSVSEIGCRVFSGAGAIRQTNTTFTLVEAVGFVNHLRAITDCYFDHYVVSGRRTTYEDVAHFAAQVRDGIGGGSVAEYENPALAPLLVMLQRDLELAPEELKRRASEAHDYICDTVWHLLSRDVDATSTQHLHAIADACRDLGSVDLFDLNHDRVLETALAAADLHVSDGFTAIDGELAWWTDALEEESIRHFKLHGSIMWFRRRISDGRDRVARSANPDHEHALNADGGMAEITTDPRPLMLVGTFDKSFGYARQVFADQHLRFHQSLKAATRVVVIGYGFGDKAINTGLIGWLEDAEDRRLIVAHGNLSALRRDARGATGNNWSRWEAEGRLVTVEQWVESLTYQDLQAAGV